MSGSGKDSCKSSSKSSDLKTLHQQMEEIEKQNKLLIEKMSELKEKRS